MDEIRAERKPKPVAPKKEPRLAYEIALGIIITGITLWTLETLVNSAIAYITVKQIQIQFGG